MAEDKKNSTPKAAAKTKAPEDKPVKKSAAPKEAPKKAASAKTTAAAPKKKAAAKKASPKKKASAQPKTPRAKLAPRTYFPKGEIERNWRIVDAEGQTLGRLSTVVANILMGKDKPTYTKFRDTGDFVVVINAEKVRLTGKKMTDKWYHYHTHFAGGIKSFRPVDLLEKHPTRIIERSVFGMLPKGHRGRQWFKKLKIYAGDKHPHAAQKPVKVELNTSLGDRSNG